jgi:hypothetical protein
MDPFTTFPAERRPSISDAMKQKITDAFAIVPEGKTGALVAIVDEHGARLHVAHKINDHWKVGAAVGRPWSGGVEGYVGIEGSW